MECIQLVLFLSLLSIDHCADVTANFGVVSQRTPRGMQLSEFHQGIEKYRKEAMARERK